MPADILRTTINIFRNANIYHAICLTCGAALRDSDNVSVVCAADREHICAEHQSFEKPASPPELLRTMDERLSKRD